MSAISQGLMIGSAVWAMPSLDLLCFVHMLHSSSLAVPPHVRRVCHHTSPTDMLGLCLPLLLQGLHQEQTHLFSTTSVSENLVKKCHKSGDILDNEWRQQ